MSTVNTLVLIDTFFNTHALLGYDDSATGSAPGYYSENHAAPADAGRMVTLKGLKEKKPVPPQVSPVVPTAPTPTVQKVAAIEPAPRPLGAGLSGVRNNPYQPQANGLGQASYAALPQYMQPKPPAAPPPPPPEPEGYDLSDEQLQALYDHAHAQHMQRYTMQR